MHKIEKGRLYPSNISHYNSNAKLTPKPVPGNGIRVYEGCEKIIGFVLLIFKKSLFIEVEGKSYLINRNSLDHFLLRRYTIIDAIVKHYEQCTSKKPEYIARWPQEMQKCYTKNKSEGYTRQDEQILSTIRIATKDITGLNLESVDRDGFLSCGKEGVRNSTTFALSIVKH